MSAQPTISTDEAQRAKRKYTRRISPAAFSDARRKNGQKGGLVKGGRVSIAVLQKTLIKEHIDQRVLRATDALLDSQISLAKGLSFLYRIDKKWIATGKGDAGYWRNEKPVLVESRVEIEEYLEGLKDEGDATDDQDEGAAYYFITTKEPNNEAIKDMLNRVHGKPRETVDVNQNVKFSLIDLAEKRAMIDGNKDMVVLPQAALDAPQAV